MGVLLAAQAPARAAEPEPATVRLAQRGVALGLFAEDPGFSYRPLLAEIARTGASHVSLVVPFYQHNLRSARIYRHPRYSPHPEVVRRTLRQARALGLETLLFPIVRLEYALTPDEWRGAIRPRDPARWWASYRRMLLQMARLARREGAAALCVGSELTSMDRDPEPWQPLLREVRRVYRGPLVYSANWNGFEGAGVFSLVDLAGLSAYFPLLGPEEAPTLERLIHGWREHRVAITRWQVQLKKPLIFTELGYHSQQGTAAGPWNEAADHPLSEAEQARCYRAFARAWAGADFLRGVYVWTWFGYGGPRSREYCPRGKAAAAEICRIFGAPKKTCPEAYGRP